jgi:hypothetical protein
MPRPSHRSLSQPVRTLLGPHPTSTRGTVIQTDHHTATDPSTPDPAELVALLEDHLAELNTLLALNTMALSAFGITRSTITSPATEEPAAW